MFAPTAVSSANAVLPPARCRVGHSGKVWKGTDWFTNVTAVYRLWCCMKATAMEAAGANWQRAAPTWLDRERHNTRNGPELAQ